MVNANGSVNRSKGIESVTKPAVGQYCVELEDKELGITKLVPTANLQLYSLDHDVTPVPHDSNEPPPIHWPRP
ncbi:hypothetical protein [Streptomyces sp. NPDC056491]|uniref:hypothetical protein n=1 Tax=Streptomyces sp. NPDC056491 TaxID=3345837 RepID=UPI00367B99B3